MRKLPGSLILLVLAAITSCTMISDMQAMKAPRFEVDAIKGAEYCAGCHREIYAEWLNNSRHSTATNAASFHHLKDEFTSKYLYKIFMGEAMCYACHGSKQVNEGVNCETCHGTVMPGASIEEVHENKFRPGLAVVKKPEFCAKCHEVKNPVSGHLLLATYDEWKRSAAATDGVTCQNCHMNSDNVRHAYHGFETAVRDVSIYRGDLEVSEVNLDFPALYMIVENRVNGHSIPAGGPSRTLALEVSCEDENGDELYRTSQTFAKQFSLMPIVGVMPYKLVKNTQLQSGEKRHMEFSLPQDLGGKIKKVIIILRMYEVSDEHRGDILKAHWASDPILRKEVNIKGVDITGVGTLGLSGIRRGCTVMCGG
jgi:hypothetical protein